MSNFKIRHNVGFLNRRLLVQDYMGLLPEAREKTLILSGTNVERLELTADLRKALQSEGSLGADVYRMRSQRLVDLQKQLQMPMVEVWIAALLGGFPVEQRGSFYQTQEVWVSRCR
ncbi:MAG: hypothetical protein WA947_13630 [Phormidesmis sp.]